ncbi:MAG: glutaredoxin family protein [Pseudomonadota bacterium]
MKRGLLLIMLLASPMLHAADLYRWIDANGRIVYSDQPPPATAKQQQKVSGKGNVVEVDKESYETRVAREANPVILYSNACGPICDQAKEFLAKRGVPYTTRDPSKDPEIALQLKKLVGTLEVPVIVVGRTHQKGFEPNSWGSILDVAGYPKEALLPNGAPPPASPEATPPAPPTAQPQP